MSLGLVGRKIGMTRIFTEDGVSIPVTVLAFENNRISQIKSDSTDGYAAVQVAFGSKKANRVLKPEAGHFAKAGVAAAEGLKEFRVQPDQLAGLSVGDVVSVELFNVGQLVDVSGITQGKGFSGAIKRHNFSSQRASHGNSVSHNAPGSIGMAQDPGRVFPGKRMAGQLGNVRKTIQSLEVIRIDAERQLMHVKGAVPGAKGGCIEVRRSVKAGV